MTDDLQPALSEALNTLWTKFLPELVSRVATLESASASLAAGDLSITQQGEANVAAHKLAGVLGTFGLTKGTVLAREAEIMYSSEDGTDPELAERLGAIAEELKAIVANRK